MSEKMNVIVVEVKESKETLQLSVVNEDYSMAYDLSLGKMDYDKATKKWSDNPEKLEDYYKNLKEFLNLEPTDDPTVLEGTTIEVFKKGENKVSFFDSLDIQKIDNSLIGELEKVEIKHVLVGDSRTSIVVQWTDGNLYAQNFNYGKWIEALKKNIPNPAQRVKREAAFKDLTGVDFANAQSLVGLTVNAEIRENKLQPDGNALLEIKKIKK